MNIPIPERNRIVVNFVANYFPPHHPCVNTGLFTPTAKNRTLAICVVNSFPRHGPCLNTKFELILTHGRNCFLANCVVNRFPINGSCLDICQFTLGKNHIPANCVINHFIGNQIWQTTNKLTERNKFLAICLVNYYPIHYPCLVTNFDLILERNYVLLNCVGNHFPLCGSCLCTCKLTSSRNHILAKCVANRLFLSNHKNYRIIKKPYSCELFGIYRKTFLNGHKCIHT